MSLRIPLLIFGSVCAVAAAWATHREPHTQLLVVELPGVQRSEFERHARAHDLQHLSGLLERSMSFAVRANGGVAEADRWPRGLLDSEPAASDLAGQFLGGTSFVSVMQRDLEDGGLPRPFHEGAEVLAGTAAALEAGTWSPWVKITVDGVAATLRLGRLGPARFLLSPLYLATVSAADRAVPTVHTISDGKSAALAFRFVEDLDADAFSYRSEADPGVDRRITLRGVAVANAMDADSELLEAAYGSIDQRIGQLLVSNSETGALVLVGAASGPWLRLSDRKAWGLLDGPNHLMGGAVFSRGELEAGIDYLAGREPKGNVPTSVRSRFEPSIETSASEAGVAPSSRQYFPLSAATLESAELVGELAPPVVEEPN